MIALSVVLGTAFGKIMSMAFAWIIYKHGELFKLTEMKKMDVQSCVGILGFTASAIATPFFWAYPEMGVMLPFVLASFSFFTVLNSLRRAIHFINECI